MTCPGHDPGIMCTHGIMEAGLLEIVPYKDIENKIIFSRKFNKMGILEDENKAY